MTEVADADRRLLEILGSQIRRMEVMREELVAARAEIASPRMTDIVDALADQDDESLIEPGQMVVTITRDGFIKRTTLETFRRRTAAAAGAVRRLHPRRRHRHPQLQCAHASMGAVLLLRRQGVPRKGLAPAGRRPDRQGPRAGQPAAGTGRRHDHHRAAAAAGRDAVGQPASGVRHREGNVRRNRLSDFRNVRAAGLIAMKLDEGDRLIGVATCREGDDVLLATAGRCIRFQITDDTLRVFAGRDSSGVRGISCRRATR
jgi:DNA gyrase subunit A